MTSSDGLCVTRTKVAAWEASWSTSPLCHMVWNPAHSHSVPCAEGPELICAALAVLMWSFGNCNGTSQPQHNRPCPPWRHHRNTAAILSVQSSYLQPHLFAGSQPKLLSVWFLFGSSQLGLTVINKSPSVKGSLYLNFHLQY